MKGVKNFEKKLSQYFLKYSNANPRRSLLKAERSYNDSIHSAFNLTPNIAHNPILDPILRKRMYKHEHLLLVCCTEFELPQKSIQMETPLIPKFFFHKSHQDSQILLLFPFQHHCRKISPHRTHHPRT